MMSRNAFHATVRDYLQRITNQGDIGVTLRQHLHYDFAEIFLTNPPGADVLPVVIAKTKGGYSVSHGSEVLAETKSHHGLASITVSRLEAEAKRHEPHTVQRNVRRKVDTTTSQRPSKPPAVVKFTDEERKLILGIGTMPGCVVEVSECDDGTEYVVISFDTLDLSLTGGRLVYRDAVSILKHPDDSFGVLDGFTDVGSFASLNDAINEAHRLASSPAGMTPI